MFTRSGFCVICKTVHHKRACYYREIYCFFCTSFYIPAIQNLAFHLPYVQIIGTNNCGNTRRESFKRCRSNQDVLCCCDYAEKLVDSFAQQIQSESYGGNQYVSNEGIALEHSSTSTHTRTETTPQLRARYPVFRSFFSDDSKQYSSTAILHSKRIIKFLNQCNIMSTILN